MKSYIVDTYAWISYFEGEERFRGEIEENALYTPSIVLAEISRITTRKKVPTEKRRRVLDFIRARSLILNLDEDDAIKAGEVTEREGLYLIDGIIYSYANEHNNLLTGDKHFKDKTNVKLIEKE